MNSLEQSLQHAIPLINQRLEELLSPSDEPLLTTIHEAMLYSVRAGGKRLRPLLCLLTAGALRQDESRVLDIACAIEMIHTYSLIHDDLPALDNDDLRRGKPTNHRVYGEAMAILAGDALLNRAFEVLCQLPLAPELVIRVIAEIASSSGTAGMIGGQVVDIQSEGKSIDMPTMRYIHENKTGRIIRSCLVSSAIACQATAEQIELFDRYGYNIGLAFQIADDILDIEGDEATMGKPVGSDLQNRKSTWPALVGMNGARKAMQEMIDEANRALDPLGDSPAVTALRDLARFIIERKN